MGSQIREAVESLWYKLVDSRFNSGEFVDSVLLDCGNDAAAVSKSDLVDVLETGDCSSMDEVAWCGNEVLAYYTSHDLGSAEFVRAVFIALASESAIKKGHGNWDFMFDKICLLLVQNMEKVDYKYRMNFLKQLLC